MRLYEINEAIDELLASLTVDEETGEIPASSDEIIEQLDALEMEKQSVLEYLAKTVLNLRADQAAVKTEEERLKKRRESMAKREQSIMNVLDRECAGQKTNLGVATISYRSSESTDVDDEDATINWLAGNGHEDCLTWAEPKLNKTALKALLKAGTVVPGATVSKKTNCSLR